MTSLANFNDGESRDARGRWTGSFRAARLTVPSTRRKLEADGTHMLADAPPVMPDHGNTAQPMRPAPALAAGPADRRSLTRGETWQRIGSKLPELPISYTGSCEREAPVDGWKEMSILWQAPKALPPEQHIKLLGKLKGIIAQHREPAAEKAKVLRQLVAVHGMKDRFTLKRRTGPLTLDPETPRGAVNRAYNHASMLALHDFGVVDYGPFKMSDEQKAELTPLIPYMRFVRRRLFNAFRDGDMKGQSAPYRAEFGKPFRDNRTDRAGLVRLRLRSNDEFVKLAEATPNPDGIERKAGRGGLLTEAEVRAAASRAALNPTPAQVVAGNYAKGHLRIGGLGIAIENRRGSSRSKVGGGGKAWTVKMPAHYGDVKGSTGADGDPVDVYLGPSAHRAHLLPVHVVDQHRPATGAFDEHKAMLGFRTRDAAIRAYDAGFSDGSGPARRKAVTTMPFDTFKEWAMSDRTSKPLAKAFEEDEHPRDNNGRWSAIAAHPFTAALGAATAVQGANLAAYTQTRLFRRHPGEIASAGFGGLPPRAVKPLLAVGLPLGTVALSAAATYMLGSSGDRLINAARKKLRGEDSGLTAGQAAMAVPLAALGAAGALHYGGPIAARNAARGAFGAARMVAEHLGLGSTIAASRQRALARVRESWRASRSDGSPVVYRAAPGNSDFDPRNRGYQATYVAQKKPITRIYGVDKTASVGGTTAYRLKSRTRLLSTAPNPSVIADAGAPEIWSKVLAPEALTRPWPGGLAGFVQRKVLGGNANRLISMFGGDKATLHVNPTAKQAKILTDAGYHGTQGENGNIALFDPSRLTPLYAQDRALGDVTFPATRRVEKLAKHAPGAHHDPRVAGMDAHAGRILRHAGAKRGKGVTDPHVAAAMGDVSRILGTRQEPTPHGASARNEAIRDTRIPLAEIIRARR